MQTPENKTELNKTITKIIALYIIGLTTYFYIQWLGLLMIMLAGLYLIYFLFKHFLEFFKLGSQQNIALMTQELGNLSKQLQSAYPENEVNNLMSNREIITEWKNYSNTIKFNPNTRIIFKLTKPDKNLYIVNYDGTSSGIIAMFKKEKSDFSEKINDLKNKFPDFTFESQSNDTNYFIFAFKDFPYSNSNGTLAEKQIQGINELLQSIKPIINLLQTI
jgi:hypothetical protein